MIPPTVLSVADLPLAELTALRLDGELYSVDGCFSPVDQPDFPSVRAAAIGRLWPQRLIVEQHSAAWVHGALHEPPERHELCADIHARARPTNVHSASVREVVIEEHEIVRLGGIGVTTPARTISDLARFSAAFDDADRETCRRLMRIGHVSITECIAAIEARPKLSNKKATIARLRTISAACERQPDDTL